MTFPPSNTHAARGLFIWTSTVGGIQSALSRFYLWFQYADDAALVDADAATATTRVTALAAGSLTDAAMTISQANSMVMHINCKMPLSSTTEGEVEALKLAHKCDA